MTASVFDRLAEVIVAHRRSLAVVLVCSAVASAIVAAQVPFDFTPQTLFTGHGTLVRDLDAFRNTFGHDDAVVLVALEVWPRRPPGGPRDVLTAAAVNWQERIARELRRIPEVAQVESLASLEVLEISRFSRRGLRPARLIASFPATDEAMGDLRDRLNRLPAIEGSLVNRDRTVAALPVFLNPQRQDVDTVKATVAAIRQALRAVPPPEGYRLHVGGLPTIRTDTIDELKADQQGLLPLGGVIYLLALALMFRRTSGSLLPLAAVGTGLAWTVAALTLAGQSLNVVSNVLPMLLLIIGISTCVQIVSTYSEESSPHRVDRAEATRRTLSRAARASFVATLTTLLGFGSLAMARSYVLKEFSLHSMTGVAFLWVAVISVLGTFFPWFAAPRHGRRAGPMIRLASSGAYWLGHLVALHPVRGLLTCGLLTLAALISGQRVSVNSYTVETFGANHPVVRTLRFFEQELSGVMPLEVVLEADAPERLLEPNVFHAIERFQERVAAIEGVLLARLYVDLHRPALDIWQRASGQPPDDATLRSRLARSDRVLRQFAGVSHFERFVATDRCQARIMLRTRDLGTRRFLEIIRQLEHDLAQTFPDGSGLRFRLTGDAYVNSMAMDGLIRDLFGSLLTASLAIFGMIGWQFRSLRVGLIAALPNLTPLALTLGYMGLRGYDMNVGNVIVFTISLGFADDTTIHFLFRFREEWYRTGSALEAIDRTFAGTGRAILQTSFLITAGLSVLLFSDFLPTRRFGELTLVTLTGNLLGVLFVLPACLMLFWRPVRTSTKLA